MAERYTVASDQYHQITGQLFEIARQIRLKGGSSIDPKRVIPALQRIVDGQFDDKPNNGGLEDDRTTETFITCLSGGCNIVIDALDGKETVVKAKKVFKFNICSGFETYGTNKPDVSTDRQIVDVYEHVTCGSPPQIFGCLGVDPVKLCLTQAQIINFCSKQSNWLALGGWTHFLFKVDGRFFVASVRRDSYRGLQIKSHLYSDRRNLTNKNDYVVIPRLIM